VTETLTFGVDGTLSCLVKEVMSVGSLPITRDNHNSEELKQQRGFTGPLGIPLNLDLAGFRGSVLSWSHFFFTHHPVAEIKIPLPVLSLSQNKA